MKRMVMLVGVLAVTAVVACGGSKESQKTDNPNPSADTTATAASAAADGGAMMGGDGGTAAAPATP